MHFNYRMNMLLTNDEMASTIVEGLIAKRLALNLTQQELAERAGLSLSFVKKFEQKRPVMFPMFIRVLRALGEFQRLESLVVKPLESPKDVFLNDLKAIPQKRRARHGKTK